MHERSSITHAAAVSNRGGTPGRRGNNIDDAEDFELQRLAWGSRDHAPSRPQEAASSSSSAVSIEGRGMMGREESSSGLEGSSSSSSLSPSGPQGATPSPYVDFASNSSSAVELPHQSSSSSDGAAPQLMPMAWSSPESPRAGGGMFIVGIDHPHRVQCKFTEEQKRLLLREYLSLRLRNKENDVSSALLQSQLDKMIDEEVTTKRNNFRRQLDEFARRKIPLPR